MPRPRIHGMIDSIAARAVVHLDNMTLGQHPDAAAREEGKLALLDWSVAGGSIVADGWEACVILTRRTSPARALGAEATPAGTTSPAPSPRPGKTRCRRPCGPSPR